jgi:hypothetical protein
MNSLLTRPDIAAAPIEAAPARATRPVTVLALQALLLGATAAIVGIWQWTWQGVQAHAWPGVDNGLAECGLTYLLILAPAVPVNLLAAIWLGRGGRRAQRYLAAAGALAVAQALMLLTPSALPGVEAVSDGASQVGIRFFVTMAPFVFLGAWIAAKPHARAWLDGDPAPTRPLVSVDTVVWCLALALAVGTATEVNQWASAAAAPGAPEGVFTEDGTWERLERAVTETTAAIPGFTGFSARTLEVVACGYHTRAGLPTFRYLLTYELRAPAGDAVAARWSEDDYTLTYNGDTIDGTRYIAAERVYARDEATHTVTLAYTEAEQPVLRVQSPCVERTGTAPECPAPQGDPTIDEIRGITCPER